MEESDMKTIDLRGKPCPEPVVESRKAMEGGVESFAVIVDNPASVKNITRAAGGLGWQAETAEEGGVFRMVLSPGAAPAEAGEAGPQAAGRVVFLASDRMGRGDDKLGGILVKAFLKTLVASEAPAGSLILMNFGVKLAVEGSEMLETLRTLEGRGWEILVCGTCLDYFDLKEKVRAGSVSNMFEIVERLFGARSVISP